MASSDPNPPPPLTGPDRAVVTGDIVGSSRLEPEARARLFSVMQEGGRQLREAMPEALPLPLDIFSGDTWQLLLTRRGMALRAAVFYRAFLRASLEGVDTRAVIAIGRVDHVPSDRVSQSEGEAFRLSGRTLQELKEVTRMRFRCDLEKRQRAWDAAVQLLDTLIQREWTPSRSRAITGALRGWKQEEIGSLWPTKITQASVSENLSGAGWPVVEQVLSLFEEDWR